jgi:orotidine-5'-phosphate decarboxylase
MTATEKLNSANQAGKFICIGLDTDPKKLPSSLLKEKDPVYSFNRQIIEETSGYAAAYKLNFAFYETSGSSGFNALKKTIELIPENILIIGDAKRGDIGNTSSMYADSVFNWFKCDSVTINPYMGSDSVQPFLEYNDKLIFILALTSNPGAQDFEKLKLSDGSFLFQKVIEKVSSWNSGNCGIVFGATKTEELRDNIDLIGNLPVLLPGVGAQGGSLEEVVKVFRDKNRLNFIINASRGIIYKSMGNDFAIAAKEELLSLNDAVQSILKI